MLVVVPTPRSATGSANGSFTRRLRRSPPNRSSPSASCPDGSTSDYERLIEAPLARVTAHQQDRRRHCHGQGSRRIRETGASKGRCEVDSELTLLYRRLTGAAVPPAGSVRNPYFLDAADPRTAPSFTHERFDIYLVTCLDGFTEEDVLGIIRRAETPSNEGQFVLDQKLALLDKGNAWLQLAADRLTQAGLRDRVILESTARVATAITRRSATTRGAERPRRFASDTSTCNSGRSDRGDVRPFVAHARASAGWHRVGRPVGYYAGSPQRLWAIDS